MSSFRFRPSRALDARSSSNTLLSTSFYCAYLMNRCSLSSTSWIISTSSSSIYFFFFFSSSTSRSTSSTFELSRSSKNMVVTPCRDDSGSFNYFSVMSLYCSCSSSSISSKSKSLSLSYDFSDSTFSEPAVSPDIYESTFKALLR